MMMMMMVILFVWQPIGWISLQTMQYKSHEIKILQYKKYIRLQRQQLIRGLNIIVQGVWYKRMSEFSSSGFCTESSYIAQK